MRILLLSLLLQPLFIFAQTKPILFPASVDSLLTLSDSLINHSQLEESVVIMEHAESLIIKNLGAQSTQYGRFCLQKAKIQKKKEEYQKAEEWYKKALHTYEVTVGKYHPEYALALSKTADFYYYTLHEYETAEPLYLTALPILKNAPNAYFKDYINTTANLGELYWNLANLKLAENKLLEAKRLWESQYGKDNKAYSGIIIVLANVYGDDNQAEKAEVLYHEAKDIGERLFGKNHVYYSTPLHNLATLAMAEKQYEKAERMFLETKSIEENTIGTENLDYANTISNLAEIYQIQGKYQAAEKYFLQAISIQKKFEEKNNLYLMDRIYGLGDLYLEIGQPLTSLKYYEEGNKLQQSALSNAASHLSEKELQAYTDYFESVQAKIYSYAQLHPEFTKLAYDHILFYKGFLLDEAKRINQLAQADSMGIDLYQQLKKNQNLLSAQYTRSSSEQEDVAVLEEKSNTLEKKLRQRIAGFSKTTKSIKWQDIQAQLEASEVAIELIHYNYYKPKATDSVMYAALMIRKGDVEPLFIPLFEEAQIKQLLTLKAPNQVAYAENIYAYQTPKKENITTLSCLYDLIWQPLQPYLNQTETIYYAPSGLFHRLNLQAIETPKKHPLADDYHFVRFNSIREFIPTDTIFNKRGDQAILMGGIQYEMNEEMVAQLSNKFDTPLIAGRGNSIAPIKTINFSIIDTNLRGNNWDYLKWTEVEVDAINFLLEDVQITPIVKKAYHANEQYFKSIGKTETSPRILHIATHGYFFPDTIGQATQYRSMDTASIYQISYHPMIRSGLILAGGNYAWKNGRAYQTGLEDGILTAYEIAQMNLSHTELVVLSACQTGLGDIEGNEGVYGLQRAFKLAGAKYLLMSLWQVPDFQTQELMTAFYYHWLEGRKSIPLAFKAAQTEIRKKYPNPFYWAGFVLIE